MATAIRLESKRVIIFAKRSRTARVTRAPKSHCFMGRCTTVGGYNTCAHHVVTTVRTTTLHFVPLLPRQQLGDTAAGLPSPWSRTYHTSVSSNFLVSHSALVSSSSRVHSTRVDNIPTCFPLDRHRHVCLCTAANGTKHTLYSHVLRSFFSQPSLSPMLRPQFIFNVIWSTRHLDYSSIYT
jgi:hypothetical protein